MKKLLAIASLLTALILFASCASIKQHHLYTQLRKEQKFSEDSIRRIVNAYRNDHINSHAFIYNKARWMRGIDPGFFIIFFGVGNCIENKGKSYIHLPNGEVVVYEFR